MRIFILLAFLSIINIVNAQPSANLSKKAPVANGIITGKIVDAITNVPLEYATISIYSSKDSTLISGTITDNTGTFQVAIAFGNYYAKLEYIGYEPTFYNNIEVSKKATLQNLGNIKLNQSAEKLVEVEVRAEVSNMQIMLDKKVFNVGQDLANTGGTAENILDNVPSVTVDIEGNVSLRGNQNVRILVDGRPSGLIGVNGSTGLRNIPANMIERVEVITNPSSKYEAEGSVGIINIVLKKDKRGGFNGSFDFNAGYNGSPSQMPAEIDAFPATLGAAINLNYRKKDFNFFINTGITYREGPGGGYTYQEFYDKNGNVDMITNLERKHLRSGYSGNLRLGADYNITDKDVLTTSFLYRYSKQSNYARISYSDFSENLNNPTGITLRTDNEIEIDPNLEYVLSYKKSFKEKGRKFTADIRYQTNTETEDSDLSEFFDLTELPNPLVATAIRKQRSDNSESETRFIIQADYIHPFNKNGKFEIGYRGSWRNIDNNYLVEELKANDTWERLSSVSNNFLFDENIQAAYANFGDKINKFSYQFGLRYEYSFISTRLVDTGEENERTYPLPFFPSVFLSYDLPKKNAIQLSYSRRLRRPSFWELNPFFSFTDARNRFGGNPNLDPEFTHSIELNHIKYWDKVTLTSSIYYRNTNEKVDRIRRLEELIENGDTSTVMVTQPENLNEENAYGFELTFNAKPYKWWNLDGNFNFYRSLINGTNIGQELTADNISWFARLTSRFTIRKNTDIQIRLNYRAPRITTQGSSKAMYHVDLGVSHDIFKNKGTLTLSVSDVFNSRRWNYETITPEFYLKGEFQWRARSIALSLNYRLNQKKRRGGGRTGGYSGGGQF
ncbi:MAG: TonB-dependent receptor domain-containing protein [Saprospiraceae bacterium]